MTFSEYLIKNRIKEDEFAIGDPVRYGSWQRMYEQMHVNSFYISVKMVLNDVRNAYHLKEIPKVEKPATETAARPVVRRAAATGSATQPASEAAQHDQPPASEPDLKANKPAMPGRRAVIRKPAPETIENNPKATSETKTEPAEAKNIANATQATASEENPVPTPVRARPVFKRPTAAADSESSDKPVTPEPTIKTDETTDSTASAAPKPVRARPVFKRPDVPALTSEEIPQASEPEIKPEPAEAGIGNAPTQNKEAVSEPKSKPARPRPVFKRPETAVPNPAEQNSPEIKPELAEAIIETATGQNQKAETPAEPQNESPTPKPPRPRPVFKRPAPPAGPSTENTATD